MTWSQDPPCILELDWYYIEYTGEDSCEAILYRICYFGHVQHIIYDFSFNILKNTFDNVELLGQDIDSLIVQLSDKGNFVHKMCDMYKSFDFSELDNTSYFYG